MEQVVAENGRIVLEGLPVERGQMVEVIVLLDQPTLVHQPKTVRELLELDAVGMWADRGEIGDTPGFARTLREEAETRDWSNETPA